MARIKLDIPNRFDFSTELSVRASDVNYGGHLGNDSMLSLLNEARIRFFKSHGFTEKDSDGEQGIIMSDVAIVYKAQAFHGDRLLIDVAVSEMRRIGCDLFYRVALMESSREVALAKTGLVFFDYSSNRIARMPEKLQRAFAGACP